VTELTYPSFPRRGFLTIGAVVLALVAAAILANRSSADLRACAVAAERVMAARNYSVATMELIGPGPISACRGLTASQFDQAVLAAYRIEYGGRLPTRSIRDDAPPPAFRARSAQAAIRSR
jgi:hypothetical protein